MKKRISILLVMVMIFSMASSFVFAEGLDAASAPVDETTVDGTEAEGAAVPGETPEEVTEPVTEGEENAEMPEEVKEEAVDSKLGAEGVTAEAVSNVTATLVNKNDVKVTWTAVNSTDVPVVTLTGTKTYTSTGLVAGVGEFTQTNVDAGTYVVTVTIGTEKGTAQITVPEAITGFATYSAYQSVVLEWNKPVTNPIRYEIWSDNAKIADVTNPTWPYDNPNVYSYQCTNASDEGKHTYFIKAVYAEGETQSDVLTDQMLMPMYIRCTFKGNATLHAHDGSKVTHKFKKGQVIKAFTFVKGQYRFYYKDHLYYCNYYRLTNKKALFNGYKKWNYSDREVEYFINTSGQKSMTKYLLFVNLYTQHLYVLKGKKGQWKVTTVKYNGKKYRDWEVASGKASSPTPGGLKLKYGKKLVNIYKKSGVVYGHQTRNWNFYHSQTALHGRVGKNIYGKPRSLGCIRNTDARAIFIRNKIPMKTRVVVY